ncbi:leucine-rich repeat-containing protein 63 isoform X2 [Bufo gargarizans]|uniref:leucine-rich repeat-containing protein 63 isoform X2 n=1 Tax=Bufo gargarizans TaxID=30331 RepID=UPI001CF398C4|nr:leucine-rich repeat-containing protein 63 isoform X2 [Bufo gargarizans]
MELPCLPLKSMLEPPKLLRRPLPPKILPAVSGKRPNPIQETGIPHFYTENQPEISLVQRSNHENIISNYAVEKKDPLIENWILDQQAPTPAASRLQSDDYPLHWDNVGILSRNQGPHKYAISEQTQDVDLMHTGPADFLSKRHHKQRVVNVLSNEKESPPSQLPIPEFTFNDIIAKPGTGYLQTGNVSDLLRKQTVSKLHYRIMEDNIARSQQKTQEKVHSMVLSSHNLPEIAKRIPPRLQLALEQQRAMVKEEEGKSMREDSINQFFRSQKLQNSQTLYDEHSRILATHCDLAMLECLVNGGHALSLKAYFISKLPDLTPLYNSLFYLNLSFNEFWQFPTEVYNLEHLESLKLRNNPIKEIPYGIHKLKKLRTFTVSFCSLTSLPAGLFLLPNLQVLDVSYNNITTIPNDIANLRALEFLNVEGNSLPALPCGALKLKLKHLRVGNNRMHPLFWRETTHIQPQRLLDLAAMSFVKKNTFPYSAAIPNEVKHILQNLTVCDCCPGVLSGEGLRFIRPCEKIFGIRKLPFMFHACSPSCYRSFMSQTESLTHQLYDS